MWISDLEDIIYTRVKAIGEKRLKEKYPNIFFTNDDKNLSAPLFPSVYVRELSGSEKGVDLDGKTINGVLETIQVDITTNTGKHDAKMVMAIIIDIFKDMRFQAVSLPEVQSTNQKHIAIARFRRVIGAGDII